jgi:heme exporter protein CcmD
MLHWFDPGKYAAFVATAYGVSALVLGALVVESLWRARRWRKAAERPRPAKAPPAVKSWP